MPDYKATYLKIPEHHRAHHVAWLRAAVLGANDGLVSTASLILGVAAAELDPDRLVVTGLAGLVAGALSMAAGEYVSVSSQADIETADLALEERELRNHPENEIQELTEIYQTRGLEPGLAREVAEQLMAHDALGAHARDELGMTEQMTARPLMAAGASAASFALGAGVPLLLTILAPTSALQLVVALGSLVSLFGLGALAAWTGGASAWRGAFRVGFWGVVAMAVTSIAGSFFGAGG